MSRAEAWKKERSATNVSVVDTRRGDDAVQEILRLSDGGVDVVLEMSGAEPAINQALAIVRPGGHLSLLGLPRAGLGPASAPN